MNDKQFYKSKTFWFNALTIILGVVEVVSKTYPIPADVLAFIMGVGNLILRAVSGQPIAFGAKKFSK